MNKKLVFAGLFFVFAMAVFVSAQAGYILQVFLLSVLSGVAPPGTPVACVLNGSGNLYLGCQETDGGFNPALGGTASVSALTTPGGALVCTGTSGAGDWCQAGSATILNEIVCGISVAPAYSTVAAVVQVDCAAYAAANPSLGLTGVCVINPNNQAGQCA